MVRVAGTYAVVAWLIIQVAVSTFPTLMIPDWALRLVTMCVLLGFPVAIILAWAYELTPEGIKTAKTAQATGATTEEHASHTKKRNWIAYVMGAVIPTVIFGALALFFFIQSRSSVSEPEATAVESVVPVMETEKSIAVLPFDNRSELKQDEFFTDGIHDDLLTLISRIRDIKTISRTSVMVYKDTVKNMKTIGEELGVKWLLEGGVQRGGDQIRINVQLIEAATDAHLWAETYTRELNAKNIFQIQSEIAGVIANELKAVLSPEERSQLQKLPTENLAALEAYFKGKESRGIQGRSAFEVAIKHFEQAISLDPDFALAHAMLGISILQNIWRSGLPLEQEVEKAQPHILKALELDETLSEAYSALGTLRGRQGDREASKTAYKKAIELNPNNAEAYHAYGEFLKARTGRTPEVAEVFRKAFQLDPKHALAPDRLAESFEALGQVEDALEARKSFARENPENSDVFRELGDLYGYFSGRWDNAIVGWLVIQVGATTFPALEIPAWVLKSLIMLVLLGFPISVVLAWAFELTPEGIKMTKVATAKHSDSAGYAHVQRKRNWLAYAIGAAVPTAIFSILVLVFYIHGGTPESATEETAEVAEKSIAVLPLENMSPNPENAFFADGVHEDIIGNLSKIGELLVIGRTSTLGYRDTTKKLKDIGVELGVSYLLEGSVRRAGNNVRVRVTLIDSNTEAQLWSEDYERTLTDTFAIQAEIAQSVADKLRMELTPAELEDIEYRPTDNQEAYDYYVRYRKLLEEPGDKWSVLIPLLESAVDLDPNFAQAWAPLAIERVMKWVGMPQDDDSLLHAARSALDTAKRINADLLEVPFAESFFAYHIDRDYSASTNLLLRALEIDRGFSSR